MTHAYGNDGVALATDHAGHYVHGPGVDGRLLEVGVVVGDEGVAINYAMPARAKFLRGRWMR